MSDQHNQILNSWSRQNRVNMPIQNNRSSGLDKITNRDDKEYVESLIGVLYNFEPNNNNLAVRDSFSFQTWHLSLENFVGPIRETHLRALSNVQHKTNGYRPIKDIAVYPPSGNSPCRLVVEFVPYASVEGISMFNNATTAEQTYFNSPMPPPSRPSHHLHQPPPEEQYYRHRSRSKSPPRHKYKPYNRSPSIERSDSRSRSRSQSPVHTSSHSTKRKKEGSHKEKTKPQDSAHRKSSNSSSTSKKKRKIKKEPQEPERGRSSSVIGRFFGGQ